MKLSFRIGTVHADDKKLPQYMKFVCSKVHISASLKKIQKEYNIQPQLIKGEIDQNFMTLSNYKEHEKSWKSYLVDDVLCLAAVEAKHAKKFQKSTSVSFKNSITESSLAWSCLGKYVTHLEKRSTHQKIKVFEISFIKPFEVVGLLLGIVNLYQPPSSK